MQTHQPFVYVVGWSYAAKYYIGSKTAKQCRYDDLGTKYFTSSYSVRAIWAYCPPNIKIIIPCETKELALELEETLQHYFSVVKDERFFNKQIGGKDFVKKHNFTHTEETKDKLREARKKQVIVHSDKTKKKLSQAKQGKKLPPSHCESIRRSKQVISDITRQRMSEAAKNRPKRVRSPETTEKIASANRGKKEQPSKN